MSLIMMIQLKYWLDGSIVQYANHHGVNSDLTWTAEFGASAQICKK